ncbi:hypothetical protein SAMN05443247_06908 [Bradyrhizobium erythrophlei]|nr:hypothetical protein SAMN05443247_06908 [Bradyrhizobium erythrophlei]
MNLSRQQRRYKQRQELNKRRGTSAVPNSADPGAPLSKPFLMRTKTIFAILSSIVTITGGMYVYWPSMEITGVPWDNSTSPMDAKFFFKNTGNVTLHEVIFECTINTTMIRDIHTSRNSSSYPITGEKSQVIGDLAPRTAISRDCVADTRMRLGSHPSNIRIDASYVWPLISHRSSFTAYFVSETDATGRTWMTPEKLPQEHPTVPAQ